MPAEEPGRTVRKRKSPAHRPGFLLEQSAEEHQDCRHIDPQVKRQPDTSGRLAGFENDQGPHGSLHTRARQTATEPLSAPYPAMLEGISLRHRLPSGHAALSVVSMEVATEP